MNGTDEVRGFSCAVLSWLGRGWRGAAEAVAAASGVTQTQLVAQRAHTCAGTCVWCFEAGVRVSRGHRSVPVCVRGVH